MFFPPYPIHFQIDTLLNQLKTPEVGDRGLGGSPSRTRSTLRPGPPLSLTGKSVYREERMPEIQIPQTFTSIKWPDRKMGGVVRIRSLLPLSADRRLQDGSQVVPPSFQILHDCFPKRREEKPSTPLIMVQHHLFIRYCHVWTLPNMQGLLNE